MALALDAVASDKANGTSVTFSHTCTGTGTTGVLYVIVGERFASAVTGVTYNGVAMTQISYNDPGANLVVCKVFRLLTPATGAHNVVVTASTARNLACTSLSFTGADQTTPDGAVVNSNGGSSTAISDAVTSATGEIVVDAAVIMENTASAATLTVGSGQTSRSNQEQVSGGNGLVAAASTEAGAASVTMSWTASAASYWVHSSFAVKSGAADAVAPQNPTVVAQEAAGGTQIGLEITMPSDSDMSQYEVRRLTTDYPANDRTNGTVIVSPTSTTADAVVNVTDSSLTNGQRYYYRVFCKDSSGNWNTGTTASEVAAAAMTVIGWYTSGGTFKSDGETGANPIFEWTVSTANVEAGKPVPFRVLVGSDNPGPNLAPTQDVLSFTSSDGATFTIGSFKYYVSGTGWLVVPLLGLPWASVNAGTVLCRYYSTLNANQDLYGVVRAEQV